MSGESRITAKKVPEHYQKRHDNVLRDISKLSCSQEFRLTKFGETSYFDKQGNEQPMIEMTKNGLSSLRSGHIEIIFYCTYMETKKYWLRSKKFKKRGNKKGPMLIKE